MVRNAPLTCVPIEGLIKVLRTAPSAMTGSRPQAITTVGAPLPSPKTPPEFRRKSEHFLPLLTNIRLISATYERLCSLVTRHSAK